MHLSMSKEKLESMKQTGWSLFDRQALSFTELMLTCNVAFNIVKDHYGNDKLAQEATCNQLDLFDVTYVLPKIG